MCKRALERAGIDAIIQADSAGKENVAQGHAHDAGTRGFLLAIERDVLEPSAKQA